MNQSWWIMIGRNAFKLPPLVIAILAVIGGADFAMSSDQADREERYYPLETFHLPDGLPLEVSGMALLPDGQVAVAIRKGEVWLIDRVNDPKRAQFRLFASGLHEPLGLAFHEGDLYTVQRTELTRLLDVNGDGIADEYRTVAKGWGVTGNYHEYAYGPVFDSTGHAWITLNCSIGQGTRPNDNLWRGWSLRVGADGLIEPISGGFRSPCGLGTNGVGDVFVTDQQGNWFPTCVLIHIRPGVFHGHADALAFADRAESTFRIDGPLPQTLSVVEAARQIDAYELPAIWFPYRKVGMSATDVLFAEPGKSFDLFEGQMFVGEFTQSFVSRVFLEKINGVYQGACFRFREGLQSAALRLCWDGDGNLLIGQSNRGWNSLGTRSFGLQRLLRTDRIPFEIQSMEARPAGFRLTFTRPVDRRLAQDVGRYLISSYTYPYHASYGGKEIDQIQCKVVAASVGDDSRSVELLVNDLREGYVHELEIDSLTARDGQELLHAEAYYTLNQIPMVSKPKSPTK